MPWIRRDAATVALACVSLTAHAALTVVANHGGQSATPYYVAISGAHVAESQGYHASADTHWRGPVSEADMLPVRSERMTPGPVVTRRLALPASTTPFFVLGTDALSVRWLKQRRTRLRQLHAVGLVVDVVNANQLRQLRRLGQGLVLRPVSGDDIARRLGLAHYPALITPTGIQQ